MLPPPAPLSPISPFSPLSSNSGGSSSNKDILLPNTAKDLPTSPRLAAVGASSAFWGGQTGNSFGGFGGGITPVHTALIPEYGFNFGSRVPAISSGKPSSLGSSGRANENINPSLNAAPPSKQSPSTTDDSDSNPENSPQQQSQNMLVNQILSQLSANNGFESFTDINPFTLKTLDSYRMQLWSRMALQQAQAQHLHYQQMQKQQPSAASSANNALSGLASNLRPHYFTSSGPKDRPSLSTSGLGSLLGKHAPHGYPTPPTSPRASSSQASSQQQQQNMQYSLLAGLAGQTILHKMGSAFWDAFSGGSSHSSPASPTAARTWDMDKVRKVIEGTAVLRVVDLEPTKSPKAPAKVPAKDTADSLEESMRSLNLGSSSTADKRQPVELPAKAGKCDNGRFFLRKRSNEFR